MVYYKGFNSDMTCRGFQYTEGESYTTDHAELCQAGFHACPMPLDTLHYYPLATSVYHEVELGADAAGDGDKRVSRHITIGAKIDIAGMIKAHLKLVWEKVDKEPHPAAASGDWSTAATSGDRSTAAVDGKHSIAVAGGSACKARGALGCWLVLAERNDKGEILDVQAVRVDGDTIKPDTLYTLTGGCVTEVGADE